jgi:cell division septation protein DedD
MSRVFPDLDETGEERSEQREFALPPLEREPAEPRREPPRTDGARGRGEPARAEFFRAQRRPVLPLIGLIGAVVTVVIFLWMGRDEAVPPPEPPAREAGELAPVASAPDFEVPFPEPGAASPGAAPSPTSLAAPPAGEAIPGAAPGAPEPFPAAPPAPEPAAEIAAATPPRAATPSPRPAARGAFSVQLLAAHSEADVGASWDRLRGAHPDLLASLTPTVARAERAQGDTFYRLRAGPLRDRAAADALCEALSARQQSCFVVSPGS